MKTWVVGWWGIANRALVVISTHGIRVVKSYLGCIPWNVNFVRQVGDPSLRPPFWLFWLFFCIWEICKNCKNCAFWRIFIFIKLHCYTAYSDEFFYCCKFFSKALFFTKGRNLSSFKSLISIISKLCGQKKNHRLICFSWTYHCIFKIIFYCSWKSRK